MTEIHTEVGAASIPSPPPAEMPRLRARSFLKLLLEVVLISAGVFLGLAGEQWRENAEHQAAAQASLRRFRAEIQSNRKAILDVREYHTTLARSISEYLRASAEARKTIRCR